MDRRDKTIRSLQERVTSLEASLRDANRNWSEEGYSNRGGRSSGRGGSSGRGRGGGAPTIPKVKKHKVIEDKDFVMDRLQVGQS